MTIPVGPRFRLAPGVLLSGGARLPLPPTPGPPDDHRGGDDAAAQAGGAAASVTIDPAWLLAPLYARDAAGLEPTGTDMPGRLDPPPGRPAAPPPAHPSPPLLAAATADWPAWWSRALAVSPGEAVPDPEALIAGSEPLRLLWAGLREGFAGYLAAIGAAGADHQRAAMAAERAAVAGWRTAADRAPGPWTVWILQIPVIGHYLHPAGPRRIVVSAALRSDAERYPPALAAELIHHL